MYPGLMGVMASGSSGSVVKPMGVVLLIPAILKLRGSSVGVENEPVRFTKCSR